MSYYITPIKIVGVGGAGCNIVKTMMSNNFLSAIINETLDSFSVEYIAMNNDLASLNINPCPKKLYLDPLRGEGQPGLFQEAAEHLSGKIKQTLIGAKIVVVAAGLGGGCGTESVPVICEVSKKLSAVVICLVTMPFSVEGKKRTHKAKAALVELSSITDRIIVLENDSIFEMFGQNMAMDECFRRSDKVLCQRLGEYILAKGWCEHEKKS